MTATLALGCGAGATTVEPEDNLGPIDQLVDDGHAVYWPGRANLDGSRSVRRINAFFQGAPAAYWFAGMAERIPADAYWFCRDGDTGCPFTEDGVVDRTRTVGDPVFSHIPAHPGYSPYWRVHRVDVGPDYQPNDIKSVAGIDAASAEGHVKVQDHIHDFGDPVGPEVTLMHSLVVLTGTILELNGGDAINEPGVPTIEVPKQHGWHQQHQLEFFEFSVTDKIFPPAPDSESFAIFPFSDLFVFVRDCDGGSESVACDVTPAGRSTVSERGLDEDITGDGDKGDSNNILSGFPGRQNADPLDLEYAPLWRAMQVRINSYHDDRVKLIDTYADQQQSDAMAPATMREWAAMDWVQKPEPMSEELANDIPIEGCDMSIFFNSPAIKPDK